MEVLHLNLHRKKPVHLFLPGYDADKKCTEIASKPLFKENREMRKTFQRLSTIQRNEKIKRNRFDCTFAVPTVTFPDSEGMNCMCYENLMSIVKDKVRIPLPSVFTRVLKPPKLTIESIRPSWTQRAMKSFRGNQKLQYPLSTVMVRWQLKRKIPKYDTKTLMYILAPFGEIRDIKVSSPNSCLVIFKDISAACRVTQSRCLGYPTNKLHCTWWHTAMTNKVVVASAKGMSVKTDHFIL